MVRSARSLLITAFIVLVAVMVSCEDRERYVGKYQGDGNESPTSRSLFLELMDNGRGSWSTEEDNVSFRWEAKGNEILLHTKSGGHIRGKVIGDTIEIDLPSTGKYYFKKVKR